MVFFEDIKNSISCNPNSKLSFHKISKEDLEKVRKFYSQIKDIKEDIFQNFFNYLLEFKEFKQHFSKKDIPLIKKKQKIYLEELLQGNVNQTYLNNRIKIGLKHYKNNIPIFNFIAAYSRFVQEFFKYYPADSETCLSLFKLFFFDVSIFAQTYLISEEEKRRKIESKYLNLFHNINDGIIVINVDEFKITDVNKKIEIWTGLNREELIGKDISYVFLEESKVKNLLKEKLEKYPVLYLKGKNNSLIPVELSISFTIEQGILYAFTIARNIQYKIEIEKQIEKLEKLYKVLSLTNKLITKSKSKKIMFDEIVNILVDTGKFKCAAIIDNSNKPVSYSCEEETDINKLLKEYTPYFEEAISKSKTLRISSDEEEKIFIPIQEHDGNFVESKRKNSYLLFVVSESITFFRDEEIQLLNEIAEDLAFALYSMKKNRKIKFLEYFDLSTKLPNRRYFFKYIQDIIDKKEKNHFALVIIDILNFKDINETVNFEAGDLLLKEFSNKLKEILSSKASMIARIGGDEFGIILEEKDKEKVFKIVKEIISQISNESFSIKGKKIFLSLNAGISFFPKDGRTPEELLAAAEAAVEEAKKFGKNMCEVFNPSIRRDYLEQLELEQDLKNALLNNEFQLFYQPIFSIKDKKIIGAEALVRWFSPKRGYVPPLYFIKTLEESGLIYDLGNFVIETAFRQIKKWEDKNIYISINISPYQIKRGNLFDTIKEYIDIYNVNPEKIVIEITETALMENIDKAQEELYRLKNLGISIAIDDFGTGYSSLSYLRELPFSSVKIDRSFIKDIPENESDIKISKAIINLAHSLDKTVIAEGIETERQLETLKRLDCDYGQGYLFSKPVPDRELEKFIK